jgi:hypothetical protein
MEGRDYIVLPVVILTEGVHSGSNGPVLYLSEDMEKYVPAWNHKPIVVYHPKKDGQFVSADDPAILSANKVGVLMANKMQGKSQAAEAWLEKSRLQQVDSRILDDIDNGVIVEVSTGLFTDNEESPGEWNGEEYDAIARNYRPDHLALLPDLVGACSIKDGCGLFTASQGLSRNQAKKVQLMLNNVLSKKVDGEERKAEDFAYVPNPNDPSTWDLPIYDEVKVNESIKILAGEKKGKKKIPKRSRPKARAKVRRAWQTYHKDEKIPEVLSELSHGEVGQKLWEKIIGPIHSDPQQYYYIQEVYDDCVVYGSGDDLYKQEYEVTSDGEVELVGEPYKVKREISYTTMLGEPDMSKKGTQNCECDAKIKGLVDNLISVGNDWKEEDREWLQKQDEKVLTKLQTMTAVKNEPAEEEEEETPAPKPKANAASTEVPVAPRKKKQMTVQEFIKQAPKPLQEVLARGLQAHEAEKARLIDIITSNEVNQFEEEELKAFEVPMLQKLAALAMEEEEKEPEPISMFSFIGQAGAPVSNQGSEDHLPLPVMNFKKDK